MCVLGYDMQNGKPVNGGGVAGTIEDMAFFVETQEGGTLHAHGVAWIYGGPRTEQEWKDKMEDTHWSATYENFLKTVISE